MVGDGRTRRRFVTEMVATCLAGPAAVRRLAAKGMIPDLLAPVRSRLANPYLENGKPVVVMVRGGDFPQMLAKGMQLLGGFTRFGSHRSVIVKPNFVFDKRTHYPTTTDEDSVLTTVQYLQKEGFSSITVADRRANRTKSGRAGGKFDWSGLNDRADEGGFNTDSLMDDGQAETIQVTNGRWSDMPSIGVIKKVYDADLIINMPTVKRHSITNLTCSLKNVMGVLDVPTTENMHLWGNENEAARAGLSDEEVSRRLCRAVAEAAMAVSPELTVIDARRVLCNDHLSVNSGLPKDANCLIISGDPVAADVCAARLLKEVHEPYELGLTAATFEHAVQLGLGVADPTGFVIKDLRVG